MLGVIRKRIFYLAVLSAFITALMPVGIASAFNGAGAGTEENPYRVITCLDLRDVSDDLDAHYVQTKDIDCSDSADWNDGYGFAPIGMGEGDFTGSYDGQNFSISNLTLNGIDSNTGLFASTNGATIQNIHLEGGTLASDSPGYNATIAAFATNTTFSDCSSTMTLTSVAQAGLVGNMSGGSITRCSYEGNIDNGIANSYTAGLIAVASNVDITDSYTAGSLTGETYSGALVGSLGGGSTVTNSYSSMDVTSIAATYSGGLFGIVDNSTLTNIFFDGSFTESATNAGAIVGPTGTTAFNGVYYNRDGCGCATAIGNGSPGSGSVTAVNTDGSDPYYFTGNNTNPPLDSWDFDTVWAIGDDTHPVLRSVASAADSDDDGISNTIEDAGPNSGDADGSGTLDSAEPFAASMPNPVTGEYSVLTVDEQCVIISLEIVGEEDVLDTGDAEYSYPGGFMDFRIDCTEPGFTSTITQLHYGVDDEDFTVRKFKPSLGFFDIEGTTVTNESVGDLPVVVAEYRITDGSSYDLDDEENGSIEDPAGIAVASDAEQLASTGSNNSSLVLMAYSLMCIAFVMILSVIRTFYNDKNKAV